MKKETKDIVTFYSIKEHVPTDIEEMGREKKLPFIPINVRTL